MLFRSVVPGTTVIVGGGGEALVVDGTVTVSVVVVVGTWSLDERGSRPCLCASRRRRLDGRGKGYGDGRKDRNKLAAGSIDLTIKLSVLAQPFAPSSIAVLGHIAVDHSKRIDWVRLVVFGPLNSREIWVLSRRAKVGRVPGKVGVAGLCECRETIDDLPDEAGIVASLLNAGDDVSRAK